MNPVTEQQPTPDRIDQARRNWIEAGWHEAADGMTVVTSIMRAHQILLARVEDALRPWNLTFPRFELLRLLAFSSTGSMPITKASQRLQVHVTSVTSAMKRLVDAGLVERVPHPTDRRTTLVAITRTGRLVVEEATQELNRAVFSDLGISADQQATLIDALTSLRQSSGDF